MLPYFRKVESFVPSKEMGEEKREDLHGYDGPITVLFPKCTQRAHGANQRLDYLRDLFWPSSKLPLEGNGGKYLPNGRTSANS
jgi:hypothetical protein